MKKAFVDTSAWYAFIKPDDPDHAEVKAAIQRWENRLVTSNFVFDEVVTLVRARMGISFVMMNKMCLHTAIATDRNFRQAGFRVAP